MNTAEVFSDLSGGIKKESTTITPEYAGRFLDTALPGVKVERLDGRRHVIRSLDNLLRAYAEPSFDSRIGLLTDREVWVWDEPGSFVGVEVKASPYNPNPDEKTLFMIYPRREADDETDRLLAIFAKADGPIDEFAMSRTEDIGAQPPDQVLRAVDFLNQVLADAIIH